MHGGIDLNNDSFKKNVPLAFEVVGSYHLRICLFLLMVFALIFCVFISPLSSENSGSSSSSDSVFVVLCVHFLY